MDVEALEMIYEHHDVYATRCSEHRVWSVWILLLISIRADVLIEHTS